MIDTAEIKRQTNLLQLIGGNIADNRVAGSGGGEYASPCPFCGGHDRFRVQPHRNDGGRWLCRNCTDGKWQDCINFVQRSRSLDFRAACQFLARDDVPTVTMTRPKPTTVPALIQSPDEDWQTLALLAVGECIDHLQNGSGMAAKAQQYLRQQRGLTAETIRAMSIGYNPTGRKIGGKFWLEAGIVIPVYANRHLWAVNVRTTKQAQRLGRPKYMAMGGSVKGALFNGDALEDTHTAVVCEGEFDTLLLSQFLPDGLATVTMGSASTGPGLYWRRFFGHLDTIYLVLDGDKAGQAGLTKWQAELPRVQLMSPLPKGHDITDAWASGFDLGKWIGESCQY